MKAEAAGRESRLVNRLPSRRNGTVRARKNPPIRAPSVRLGGVELRGGLGAAIGQPRPSIRDLVGDRAERATNRRYALRREADQPGRERRWQGAWRRLRRTGATTTATRRIRSSHRRIGPVPGSWLARIRWLSCGESWWWSWWPRRGRRPGERRVVELVTVVVVGGNVVVWSWWWSSWCAAVVVVAGRGRGRRAWWWSSGESRGRGGRGGDGGAGGLHLGSAAGRGPINQGATARAMTEMARMSRRRRMEAVTEPLLDRFSRSRMSVVTNGRLSLENTG